MSATCLPALFSSELLFLKTWIVRKCVWCDDFQSMQTIRYQTPMFRSLRLLLQDCVLSEWGEWTACSVTCDSGYKAQMRRVMREAERGGARSLRKSSAPHTKGGEVTGGGCGPLGRGMGDSLTHFWGSASRRVTPEGSRSGQQSTAVW